MKSGSCAYVNEARVSRSHKGWELAQLAAVMNGRGTYVKIKSLGGVTM